MTRAQWYERLGGRWRTARRIHKCDGHWGTLPCLTRICVGDRYFDTNDPKIEGSHIKRKLCTQCANQNLS
jgi:hypothetical protein